MPSHFNTCLLVTPSLEDDQFHLKEDHHAVPIEHHLAEVLDHHYDAEDRHYLEEERLLEEKKVFQEVHDPQEAYDFGSEMDTHQHEWHTDEPHHQHTQYANASIPLKRSPPQKPVESPHSHLKPKEEPAKKPTTPVKPTIKPAKEEKPTTPVKPIKEEEDGKGPYDNVLEDDDPAICFVKAYARKPLSTPITTAKPKPSKNTIEWGSSSENDWFDNQDQDN